MLETSIISYLAASGAALHGSAAVAFGTYPKLPKTWSVRISCLSLGLFLVAMLRAVYASTLASTPGVASQAFLQVAPDGLALSFALLVTTLSVVVFKFSHHYLDGSASERGFYPWGHTTIFGVLG